MPLRPLSVSVANTVNSTSLTEVDSGTEIVWKLGVLNCGRWSLTSNIVIFTVAEDEWLTLSLARTDKVMMSCDNISLFMKEATLTVPENESTVKNWLEGEIE